MLMLDQQWGAMQLGQYKLVLLHHMAHNVRVDHARQRTERFAFRRSFPRTQVIEFVRSMVEWMSQERQKAFDARRHHPCVCDAGDRTRCIA